MRLVFAGTPDVAVTALQRLLDSSHQVVGVLTRPDGRARRGGASVASPVKQFARSHGLDVFTPATLRGPEAEELIRALGADAAPVVAYGNLIPENLLHAMPHGWVNLHFSLLPRWRGAAPVQRALMAGDQVTGASTFQIDKSMDTGDVFLEYHHPLTGQETAGQVFDALADAGAELLVRTLDLMEAGQISVAPQDHSGATHAAKVSAEDARLNFGHSTHSVFNTFRGVTPLPGAWFQLNGTRVKVLDAAPAEARSGESPGTVRVEGGHVYVATADGALDVKTVQPAGKKAMPAADWARGATLHGSVAEAGA